MLGVVVVGIRLLLGRQHVGRGQVRKIPGHLAVMEDVMAAVAQAQVALGVVRLAAVLARYKMMDLQRAAAVRLGPPTDRARPMLLHPFNQRCSLCVIHAASVYTSSSFCQLCADPIPAQEAGKPLSEAVVAALGRLIMRLEHSTGTLGYRWIHYQPVARISRDQKLTCAD